MSAVADLSCTVELLRKAIERKDPGNPRDTASTIRKIVIGAGHVQHHGQRAGAERQSWEG